MRRNLCFYKESSKPWTQEEVDKIYEYTGSLQYKVEKYKLGRKYIFDDGSRDAQHTYLWGIQTKDNHFGKCEQVCYEKIFKQKFKYYIKDRDV